MGEEREVSAIATVLYGGAIRALTFARFVFLKKLIPQLMTC